jgi:hypothetical protein
MSHHRYLLVVLVAAASCQQTAAKVPKPSESVSTARLDTSLAKLCASPPDTTAAGAHGCVLRDQGRVLGPRPRP